MRREISLQRIRDDTVEQLIDDEIAAVRVRVRSLKMLAALVTRKEENRTALRDELTELVNVAQRCRAELSKPLIDTSSEELLVRQLVASRNPSWDTTIDSPPHHQGLLSPLPDPPPPPPPEFPSSSPRRPTSFFRR